MIHQDLVESITADQDLPFEIRLFDRTNINEIDPSIVIIHFVDNDTDSDGIPIFRRTVVNITQYMLDNQGIWEATTVGNMLSEHQRK